jgi:hypothetical protein
MRSLSRPVAAVAAALLATVVLAAPASATSCETRGGIRYCEVPNVVGMTNVTAKATLKSFGFAPQVERFQIDRLCNHRRGTVASQSPRPTAPGAPLIFYPEGTSAQVWVWQWPAVCP